MFHMCFIIIIFILAAWRGVAAATQVFNNVMCGGRRRRRTMFERKNYSPASQIRME